MTAHGRGSADPNYEKKFAYEVIREGEGVGTTEYADTLSEIAEASTKPGVRIGEVDEGFFAHEPENSNRKAWRSRGKVGRGRWERLVQRPPTLGQARRELEAVLDKLADDGFSIAGSADRSIRIVIGKREAVLAPRIGDPSFYSNGRQAGH